MASYKSQSTSEYLMKACFLAIYSKTLLVRTIQAASHENGFVDIVVKTPVGRTSQASIQNCVIQGDVFAPLLCSKQIDEFGKECL